MVPVHVNRGNVRIGVILLGRGGSLGAKGSLARFMGRMWGPGVGLCDFNARFGGDCCGRCRIGSLVDGHGRTVDVAMAIKGGYESE